MSEKEKIVCAAIQYNAWDICQEKYRDEPFYICGLDYESIMESDAYIQCCILKSTINDKKGFITNKNRFVDAKEAMSIALKACQIQAVESIAMRAAHHRQLGNTSTARAEESALVSMVELYLARELKPEDLY